MSISVVDRSAVQRRVRARLGLSGSAFRWIVGLLVLSAQVSAIGTLSELFMGLAVLIGAVRLVQGGRWNSAAIWATVFAVFWLAYSAVVGSLPGRGDVTAWLSTDGRTVLALIPFVVLGVARPTSGDVAWFHHMLRIFIWLDLLLFMAAEAGANVHGAITGGLYFGLMSSHHGPGMFAGVVIILVLANWKRERLVPQLLDLLAALVVLAGSGSRTGVLGLACATVWFLLLRGTIAQRVGIVIAIPLVWLGLSALDPHIAETTDLLSADSRSQAVSLFDSGRQQQTFATLQDASSTDVQSVANAETRFAIYGFAIGRWETSPFLGIGAGRLDNIDVSYSGHPGTLDVVTQGTQIPYWNPDAHNQFLQSLAEDGIVGLALMLSPYIASYATGRRRRDRSGRTGQALVVYSLGTALTGATLQSPALTFIVVAAMQVCVTAPKTDSEPVA